MRMRTLSISLAGATMVAALAGCAGLNTLTADVSSFGDWPAGKAAGSYAFDRLPSQQANARSAEALEAAARPALAKAGFKPAAPGAEPDVLVQVGVRAQRDRWAPWADPLWLRGVHAPWAPVTWARLWYGPGFGTGVRADFVRYETEVALLIRDRASGKPLFEARAAHEGATRSDAAMVGAMFEAALVDFPRLGINPRPVTVTIAP